MNNAILRPPPPVNEPVRSYAPGSPERAALRQAIQDLRAEEHTVLPVIGGEHVETGKTAEIRPPHDLAHRLGEFHKVRREDVDRAIRAALDARHDWMRMAWTDRAAIFLKAAELLAGPYRYRMNAATMLGQSKNPFQAEIDSACELIDFWRYNVHFAAQIYADQPVSPTGVWNRVEYRPLEGFVFAVTPFNFTSIAGNLPTAPALMGNTVLWKPASTAMLSAMVIMEILEEAGLPPGVINMLPGDGPDVGDPVFASEHFAGIHFTGSTGTFNHFWKTIGENVGRYRSYPRIVGETGGKDFIVAHESADPEAVATAIVRGSFEYQGQKCSAASRIYVPEALWPEIEASMMAQLGELTMGPVEDFSNFVNAVIDEKSFRSITGYIEDAKAADGVEVLHGGGHSAEEGYFIEPTVLKVEDPAYVTMCEEIFGPVASLYVAPASMGFEDLLRLVDRTSPYALTGAVFATDRAVIARATDLLADAAGNFYVNDKPTGAVVGQQPFGGARGSGTNDKAGSYVNLLRWTSLRAIKETFVPPTHYAYPFHQPDAQGDSLPRSRGEANADKVVVM
ncbi:MAG TPA: L-glutamate gamma-semialdehyde dehydrogenase [Rubricoccaceae bacterium]|nr:L-glutamate gamma-semialdehyde dehydrogenase [Rubricoccaceae bacterium]